MAGYVDRLAVGSDPRGDRLAADRHACDLPAARQVDHRDAVVETIADIEPRAVGRDCRADRRMAGRNRVDHAARVGLDHADRAMRGGAGDIDPLSVRAQNHARRLGRHGDRLQHLAAGSIHNGNLPCIGIGHEQASAVFRRDHRRRAEVGRSLGGRDCQHRQPDSAVRNSACASTSGMPLRVAYGAILPGNHRGPAASVPAGPGRPIGLEGSPAGGTGARYQSDSQ